MSRLAALPKLSIASLGGTLSMQAGSAGEGVTPCLDCETLLACLPQLRGLAQINATTLCLQPSPSLDLEILFTTLAWAQREVADGAQAVVLTQGTDMLEESAYFLDLLWPSEVPLVVTGAMRAASEPGADGPANLLAAAQVGLAHESRGRGVLVVLNDEIHAAAKVRKVASMAIAAFASPCYGALGMRVESAAVYNRSQTPRTFLARPPDSRVPRVALLEACLDADTALLRVVPDLGYAGLVVAGFGAGHVSASWAEALAELATRIPVLVATRTGSGSTARSTYGFAGSEMDLRAKGVWMAGTLCPRKCRLLLGLLLATGNLALLEQLLQR